MLNKQRGRIPIIMFMSKSYRRQVGVSLIELMVGMVIGLIIVGAASTVYVNAVRSGSDTLRSAKLNIELRGAMDMMVAEIRRAGYSLDTANLSSNPFTQTTTTDLAAPGTGCILFSYDANGNGTVDTSDFFGFKLTGSAASMRFGGTSASNGVNCAAAGGSWESITDPNSVIVDSLTFAIAYQCMNAQTGLSSSVEPCSTGNSVYTAAMAAASKSDLIEIRDVTISLVGHHKDDALTTMSLSQSVRVRNDRIQTVP